MIDGIPLELREMIRAYFENGIAASLRATMPAGLAAEISVIIDDDGKTRIIIDLPPPPSLIGAQT